jgi:two-component system, response regulator RegA
MEFLAKVLVVDESPIFRKLMQVLLSPYARTVLAACGRRDACERIAEHADISLVLSDVGPDDGDGFAILSFVRQLAEPKPRVLLLTTHPSEDDAKRAAALGALGYLSKPTTLQDIRRACKSGELIPRRPPVRVRRPSFGTALLIEPAGHAAPLAFEIHDLSVSGAFLETQGPLPVGTEIQLALLLGDETLHVRARVVRIQEPSWANVAGVGVRFDELPDAARRSLEARIESATRAD